MEQSFDYWHTSGVLFKAGGILLQGRVEDAVALLPLMRERVYRGVWACALTCYFSEARDTLAAVYGTYTEGFTTPDLMEARVLLERLAEIERTTSPS